jgi:hypothetical protein
MMSASSIPHSRRASSFASAAVGAAASTAAMAYQLAPSVPSKRSTYRSSAVQNADS